MPVHDVMVGPMYSYQFSYPDAVPTAFSGAVIAFDLTAKMPDVEIDFREFLDVHRSMFVQPYLDEIAEFAGGGAFGCAGPITIDLAFASTKQGRITIKGRRCTALLLTAVLNLVDHMNRRSTHTGPYRSAQLSIGSVLDPVPHSVALERGEFPVAAYTDFQVSQRGAAVDPLEEHALQLSFPTPAEGIDEESYQRLTGLYEGFSECGLWIPRAHYQRWAAAFSEDCEIALQRGKKQSQFNVFEHLGPLTGLLDLLRAFGITDGNVTVTAMDSEMQDG